MRKQPWASSIAPTRATATTTSTRTLTTTSGSSTSPTPLFQLSPKLLSRLKDPTILTDWDHWFVRTNSQRTLQEQELQLQPQQQQEAKPEKDIPNYFDVYDPGVPVQSSSSWIARIPSLHPSHPHGEDMTTATTNTVGTNSTSSSSSLLDNMIHTSYRTWEDTWRETETTASHRAQLLSNWSTLIRSSQDDLATILTMESGKPLQESYGEIKYAASYLDFYAGEAIRSTNAGGGFLLPTPFTGIPTNKNKEQQQQQQQPQEFQTHSRPRGQIMVRYGSVGVCALITPWNFPAAMITRKVGPALAAGCTVLIKPSPQTPLTAMALVTLAYRAGIPQEVIQLLLSSIEDTPHLGRSLCQHEKIQKISFTGSTHAGKWLVQQSSSSTTYPLKRFSLELGGNAPFIVFQDANLDEATTAAVASKFRAAGQTCVCADRFLIHTSILEPFLEQLLEKISTTIVLGHGLESSTTMGPLISHQAVDRVRAKVSEAISMGSTLHLGGQRPSSLSSSASSSSSSSLTDDASPHYLNFYEPTVLSQVPLESDLWKTETFGPVIAIRAFETEEEALTLANQGMAGLAAYICTRDLSRAFRMTER